MPSTTFSSELAHHLKHLYGDLLDYPLLAPAQKIETPSSKRRLPTTDLSVLAEEARSCQRCALHIGRGKSVFGRGFPGAKLAFVGDAPSDLDDAKGEPFSDEAGALLHKMILAMKLRPEETYLTNLFKCRPPSGQILETSHYLACESILERQFSSVQASFIVAMGDFTARSLARSEAPLRVLRGQFFDWQGRTVLCTHHPRDLLRSPDKKREAWEDLQLLMRKMESKK